MFIIEMENTKVIIEFLSAGQFMSEENWIHPKRTINSYEIIFVTEGTVYFQKGNDAYTLTVGDALIVEPDILHFGYEESRGKTSFYWIHFTTDSLYLLKLKKEGETNCSPFTFSRRYKVAEYCTQLLHTANTSTYPAYTKESILLLILSEIAFEIQHVREERSRFLYDLAEWIRINADRDIGLSEIAKKYGYNQDHITRLFKGTFNVGIKEYINEQRISYAKNLLFSTNLSIKEIADLLSFKNANHFINYFKYHQKISPSKYRNTYYETHLNKR